MLVFVVRHILLSRAKATRVVINARENNALVVPNAYLIPA